MATKIVIITEKVICDDVTDVMEELGASGYTLTGASGKGSRGVRSSERQALNDANANVKIESIVSSREIAHAIAKKVAEDYLGNYSGIIYLEEVEILRPEKFIKA